MNRFLSLLILAAALPAFAQSNSLHNLSANQEFKVLVYENTDSTLLTFGKSINNRGLLGDSWKVIKGAYRSTALGTVSSVSADLLSQVSVWSPKLLEIRKETGCNRYPQIANIQGNFPCNNRSQTSMPLHPPEVQWILIALFLMVSVASSS